MDKKNLPTWAQNFKTILSNHGFQADIPEFLYNYIQGYVDQMARMKQSISILEEEKRELLRFVENSNRLRAEAQMKLEKLEELQEQEVNVLSTPVS